MVDASAPRGWYDARRARRGAAVAGLAAFGLEVRHLRAYKAAADREVGLFAQLVGAAGAAERPGGAGPGGGGRAAS